MTVFNEANDIASEAVYGVPYHSGEPSVTKDVPNKVLIFTRGEEIEVIDLIGKVANNTTWGNLANRIQSLLEAGYCFEEHVNLQRADDNAAGPDVTVSRISFIGSRQSNESESRDTPKSQPDNGRRQV